MNNRHDDEREPLDFDDELDTKASTPPGDFDEEETAPRAPAPKTDIGSEYALQVMFDPKEKKFLASCLEFPGLKATGSSREDALREIGQALVRHIQSAKNRGDKLVEPIYSRSYPEKLEVGVSQSLFRKLDLVSRQERVTLDQLVSELLSTGVDRRLDRASARPSNQQQPQQQRHHRSQGGGGQHNHGNSNDNRGNQRHPNHRHGNSGGRGNSSRRSHEMLDNRENFMEYVRNLEKGGGGGWRKK